MNIYKLSDLSESIQQSKRSQIQAYAFDDSLTISEAISEMDAVMASMSADNDTDYMLTESVLIEAAFSAPNKLDVVSEAVLKDFFAKLKEWYEKLVAMVKGMIDKIKQYLKLSTKNRSEFVERIRKAITDKQYVENTSKTFKYSGYKWKSGFLANPVLELETLGNKAESYLSAQTKGYKENFKDLGEMHTRKAAEAMKGEIPKTDEAAIVKLVETELNVKLSEIVTGIKKAARETESKAEITDFKAVSRDAMITFIEGADDFAEKIVDAYDGIKTKLEEIVDILTDYADTEIKNVKTYKAPGTGADTDREAGDKDKYVEYADLLKKRAAMWKGATEKTMSALNLYSKTCQNLTDEAVKEFMRALKAFVMTKSIKA